MTFSDAGPEAATGLPLDSPAQLRKQWHRVGAPLFIHLSWGPGECLFLAQATPRHRFLCFREPFHELLASLTPAELRGVRLNSVTANFAARPKNGRGPAFRAGNVAAARERPGRRIASARAPISEAVALPRRQLWKVPIFGSALSLGRASVLKKQFSGGHVFRAKIHGCNGCI
jgi:hypothetical protein